VKKESRKAGRLRLSQSCHRSFLTSYFLAFFLIRNAKELSPERQLLLSQHAKGAVAYGSSSCSLS